MKFNLLLDTKLKKNVFIVTTLGSFLVPFMSSSLTVALPVIGKEFNMNAVWLNWIATAYLLAASVFLIPFGKMSDMFGRKKIFKYGIIFYSVISVLNAASWDGTSFIFFRFIQGISAAMIFSSNIAMLTSVFPHGERGKILGINIASTYTGLTLGPVLGGFLTQQLSWRSIFYLNSFIAIIIIFFIIGLKDEWKESKKDKFDFVGALLYGLIIFCIIYGFSILPGKNGFYLIAAGLLGILSFIRWEIRTKYPLFDLRLFRYNRVFAYSNLATFINYSATFAVGFLLSLYLFYIKGMKPQTTGIILLAQPVIMAVFSPLSGKTSDKIEPRIIASIGMGISFIGLLSFTFLGNDTSILVIIISLIILGFGFALFSSPNANAVMSSVEKQYYGITSATLATMRLTGQVFSMGITTLIFSVFIGQAEINPENFSTFLYSVRFVFLVFALLSFLGIFASLARGKVREEVSYNK